MFYKEKTCIKISKFLKLKFRFCDSYYEFKVGIAWTKVLILFSYKD